MVKLAKSKVSKIQNRLNKNPAFTEKRIDRPYAQLEEKVIGKTDTFYVAQMDAATASVLDHNGGIVIRFCDPGSMDLSYRNAQAVLKIEQEFNPDERYRRDSDEVVELITNFLKEHPAAKHIHIHCKYGEQRSVGFVNGLSSGVAPWVKFHHFYKTPDGVRSKPYHLANMGSGSNYHMRVGMQVASIAPLQSFGSLSEEIL